ncbi:MAG: hypothetical protein LH473_02905, partial [Chitinophagales bacterium]|nr:hypothetical protein [Chitinophagales bacterium]
MENGNYAFRIRNQYLRFKFVKTILNFSRRDSFGTFPNFPFSIFNFQLSINKNENNLHRSQLRGAR